ncbi:MAG: hypothetical protein MJ219_04640 [Mycoplasmoidaceae bacterium]|nr:hypothetical protein [Mycoplasmoidaceae bacterium]
MHLAGTATEGTLTLDIEKIDYNRHLVSINITIYTDPAADPSFVYKFKNIEMHGYYGQYLFDAEQFG